MNDIIDAVVKNDGLRVKEIAVPEVAQAEIKRLHLALVEKAKAFENARVAFGEFVRIARRSLHIPENEQWEIKEDASAFIHMPEGK